MKLLEKTIFKNKNKEIKKLEKIINMQFEELSELQCLTIETVETLTCKINDLKETVKKKEKARRIVAGRVGGLTKYNNRLKEENQKLYTQLEWEKSKNNK